MSILKYAIHGLKFESLNMLVTHFDFTPFITLYYYFLLAYVIHKEA